MKDPSVVHHSLCHAGAAGEGPAGQPVRVKRRELLRSGAVSLAGIATLSGFELLRPLGTWAQELPPGGPRVSNFVLLSTSVSTPRAVGPLSTTQFFTNSQGVTGELSDAYVRLVRSIYRFDYRLDQPVNPSALPDPSTVPDVVSIYRNTQPIIGFTDPQTNQATLVLPYQDNTLFQKIMLTGPIPGRLGTPQGPEDVPVNYPPAPVEPNSYGKAVCYRLPLTLVDDSEPNAQNSVRVYEICTFYAFAKSLAGNNGPDLDQGSQIDFDAEGQHHFFDVRANPVTAATLCCSGGCVLATAANIGTFKCEPKDITPQPPERVTDLLQTDRIGLADVTSASASGGASSPQPLNMPVSPPGTDFPDKPTPTASSFVVYGALVGKSRREATWTANFVVAEGQDLTVEVYLPALAGGVLADGTPVNKNARYTLSTADGVVPADPKDQSAGPGWVSLGNFPFNPGMQYVKITNAPPQTNTEVLAAAVRWRA